MEPRILDFVPASTINDRAAAARKAARLVRGDDEAADDPTCVHHAITNVFRGGARLWTPSCASQMMNISDEIDSYPLGYVQIRLSGYFGILLLRYKLGQRDGTVVSLNSRVILIHS
eukprot:5014904-Pleurochrysis_carterae.AAC.1